LLSGQGRPIRLLFPVRPRVGADDPPAGADHARAKRGTGTSSDHGSTESTA
jgi:hypothetical protein